MPARATGLEPPIPVALTIAGSDSGGGAGIVADVSTFSALGVWPTVAVTAVTSQNTLGVQRVDLLDPDVVVSQIRSVANDFTVAAVKTGMLGTAAAAKAVAAALDELGLPAPVVDPVLASSSGTDLSAVPGVALLVPVARVVTPNLIEASALTGLRVEDRAGMAAAAVALVDLGAAAALVTGGHLDGDEVADCLLERGGEVAWFTAPRIRTTDTHGTGCVLSAAIAAGLAQGAPLGTACVGAIGFVRAALARSRHLGRGSGPVDPTAAARDLS